LYSFNQQLSGLRQQQQQQILSHNHPAPLTLCSQITEVADLAVSALIPLLSTDDHECKLNAVWTIGFIALVNQLDKKLVREYL
jgi:hypothetical protein